MHEPILGPSGTLEGSAGRRMTLREAAREMETSFVAELLKAAREAGEPLAEKSETAGSESYQELAERHLAQDLARRGMFGFATLIERDALRPDPRKADKPVGRAEP